MKIGRVLSIARKESRHILRDPYTLALALALPLFLVAFFGLAIDFNVSSIQTTVYDRDRTTASRKLVETFESSNYFRMAGGNFPNNPAEDLDSGRAKAVLIIEPRFAREIDAGRPAQAQVLIDGADNSTVGVVLNYLAGIQSIAQAKLSKISMRAPIELKTRFLFNSELSSQWFIVPGLSAVVLAILSIMLTALTVAREWENGSMEMLLSTPVHPLEIIAGKLAPYLVLGMGIETMIYLVARLGFGVPFQGSHMLFALGSLLFIGAYMAQGIFISVMMRQQQLSMQLAIVSGLLPSLLLSGFIFPIESMPKFFQYFTAILPARWFMTIIRGVFLKGMDLADLAVPFAALLALNVVLLSLAIGRFKRDVEP